MTRITATLAKIGMTALRRSGIVRAFDQFGRNDKGATAVEFSLVALPFFALMFAIIETALAFFAQNYFEDTLARVSRQVRTGQAQKVSGMDATAFKALLCAQLKPMFDCPAGVTLDIRTYTDFSELTAQGLAVPVIKNDPDPKKNGSLDKSGTLFDLGKGGDIVRVRAYYTWPVFVNRLGNNLANLPDGTHLIVARRRSATSPSHGKRHLHPAPPAAAVHP